MTDLVNITNTGDRDFTLPHDGLGHVTITPGQTRTLPFEYASTFFGHPAVRNEGKDLQRVRERERVQTIWGFYAGIDDEDEWRVTTCPQFTVTDLDGKRIYMVLEDPDGSLAAADSESTSAPADAASHDLAMQVAQLQRQLSGLLRAQAQQQAADSGAVASEESAPAATDATTTDDGTAQAARNEARDEIPEAPENETVATDTPRTPATRRRAGR